MPYSLKDIMSKLKFVDGYTLETTMPNVHIDEPGLNTEGLMQVVLRDLPGGIEGGEDFADDWSLAAEQVRFLIQGTSVFVVENGEVIGKKKLDGVVREVARAIGDLLREKRGVASPSVQTHTRPAATKIDEDVRSILPTGIAEYQIRKEDSEGKKCWKGIFEFLKTVPAGSKIALEYEDGSVKHGYFRECADTSIFVAVEDDEKSLKDVTGPMCIPIRNLIKNLKKIVVYDEKIKGTAWATIDERKEKKRAAEEERKAEKSAAEERKLAEQKGRG